MTLPPTGAQLELTGGGYHAIVTASGATLRGLWLGSRPVVPAFAEDQLPQGGAGQQLLPWPNRIGNGSYEFNGTSYQLALSEPTRNNAIHGLVRWVTWNVVAHSRDKVTLGYRLPAQSGYPWTLDLETTYTLAADGLTVTTRATNRAATGAPFAYGAHPYLTAGGTLDDWMLLLPASSVATTDQQLLPELVHAVDRTRFDFRDPRRIGDEMLDHGFTDLTRGVDGRTRVVLRGPLGKVTLWGDEHITCLQVFTGDSLTPPRQAIAVEPMTAMADAFRHGSGYAVLAPEATCTVSWGIQVT